MPDIWATLAELAAEREAEHRPPAANGSHPDTDATGPITGVIRRLLDATEGERNAVLWWAARKLGRYAAGGHGDLDQFRERLTRAAHAIGLDDREIPGTITSGFNKATSDGPLHPAEPLHVPAIGAFDPDQGEDDENRDAHARAVAREIFEQRARREARRALDAEEAVDAFRPPPYRPTLTQELAIPDEPVSYLVDKIIPSGANVLLAAQYKTGKTTLINDLTRSLVDDYGTGQMFLGQYPVAALDGRVGIFNYEVDERQYRRWLRDLGIRNTDQVAVLNVRGYRMPVKAKYIEDWIVDWLTNQAVAVWIIDPFARAVIGSAKSENDNMEVGEFLDTVDVIKSRAGVGELIMPTHTGRATFNEGDERARGATRLDDWADVRWILTKDDQDQRFFAATGRDVDEAEQMLTYDAQERRLTVGGGSRVQERKRSCEEAIVATVVAQPGIKAGDLKDTVGTALGHTAKDGSVTAAIKELVGGRKIIQRRVGTAFMYYPLGHLEPPQ